MMGNRKKDRERENRGGGETTMVARENAVGFREKVALVDFDRWYKSTLGYFWRRQSIEQ
jgi:hypothetical protein